MNVARVSISSTVTLEAADDDLVAEAERLGQQDQDAGQEVLQDVAEREADGDAADAEDLDQLRRLERGDGDHQRDQHAGQHQPAFGQAPEHAADVAVLAPPVGHVADHAARQPGRDVEDRVDQQRDDDVGQLVKEARNQVLERADGRREVEGHRLALATAHRSSMAVTRGREDRGCVASAIRQHRPPVPRAAATRKARGSSAARRSGPWITSLDTSSLSGEGDARGGSTHLGLALDALHAS